MIAVADGAYLGTQQAWQRRQQPAANRGLSSAVVAVKPRDIRAKYDAAGDSVEFQNYWASTDAYDADSANSKSVRTKLVRRSRYEVGNNGFADGIAQTHANFVVGLGPSLRMRTADAKLNKAIQEAWKRWSKAVQLRRKLWAMSHAKLVDGESFALIVNNPSVAHKVKLDFVCIECDQVTTPNLAYRRPGQIDGLTFDEWSNVLHYDVLQSHPGSNWSVQWQRAKQVPKRFMAHWFHLRRPGQHRGVPECKSTLHAGASSRRWREATVSAAETAASFASLLYTETNPGEAEQVAPFSTLEIERRMMAALPAGWKAEQMAAQHPNATYESFNRAQIAETARPKNMPYNMAACDSSQSSYASGRLDFQPYFAGVDIERADCEDTVLDVAFAQWWREAALVYRLGDPTEIPDHGWDWPDHPVADLAAEANANDSKLRNGSTTLRQIYADAGNDFDDALPQMAEDYGVTVDEMRKILRLAVFNGTNQLGSMEQAAAQRDVAETQAETQIEVSQSTPINAEGNCVKWIRIGARDTKDGERKGGFAACLDSDGTITRGGPKALRNKHVSDVGKTFKRMANSPAAHKAKYDRQVEQRAKSYGVSVEEYQQIEKDAIDEAKRYHDEREAAKKYARKITGLSQADVNRLENQGYDYSSGRAETKGLDVSAVEVARQYPGLGIDPEGDDVDAQVWELIREGDKPFPAKASDEYHRIVDDYIQHMSRNSRGGASDYLSDIDPSTMEFEAKRKAGDV